LQQIKAYLDQIATISNSDWDFFTSKLQRRVIPKKSIFLEINEVGNYISFIESGVVRLFIPKENPEKEITFGFSFKDQFISAYGYGVMHRMHHAYTDTEKDPHSPSYDANLFAMMLKTKMIYQDINK